MSHRFVWSETYFFTMRRRKSMKKMKLSSLITGLFGLVALVAVAASPAQAAFVVGGENGWQMSFDGMINAFMVYDAVGNKQLGNGTVVDGAIMPVFPTRASQGFEIRTGLLPSIFAFNVKSPTINGVDYGARIGLYPQIQNNGARTGFGPDTLESLRVEGLGGGSRIDIREVFFTADTCYGQVLGGRALNLFEGKNILTDMTLLGVGVPLDLHGAGTTLGHIGYGYSFPSFGAQFRYTTPDYKGFKWAFSLNEPSKITSNALVAGFPGIDYVQADKMNQPAFQTEFSYATTYQNGKMQAWVSGLYQEAKFGPDQPHHADGTVSSIGGAGGIQASYGPVDGLISGYGGQALGLTLTQDDILTGSLDSVGKERTTYGGLAQVTYTIGKAKLGVNYGINYANRTNFDQSTDGSTIIKSQQAATGGVYYSLNKYMMLVGEYTWARTSWYDNSRQDQNIGALGTVFTW
jgi:hypothetical protein